MTTVNDECSGLGDGAVYWCGEHYRSEPLLLVCPRCGHEMRLTIRWFTDQPGDCMTVDLMEYRGNELKLTRHKCTHPQPEGRASRAIFFESCEARG